MLTEQELINGDVLASEDMDGVDTLIQTLHNEIMKKRAKIFSLHREKKSESALELQNVVYEMQKELDNIVKSQLTYMKYLKAIGQSSGQQPTGVSKELRNQKSSNGAIVQLVPKN